MSGHDDKMMLDLERLRQFIEVRGCFPRLERKSILPYDRQNALQAVMTIGRARSPHFVLDEENRFAYENFIKWCHADPTMQALDPITGSVVAGDLKRGIYIAGNTGTGKSWCLEVMLVYAQAWGFKVSLGQDAETRSLQWALHRADDICHDYMTRGEIQRFKQLPLLGIQDLGQEPKEMLYMGNRQNVLQQLLEWRGDRSDQLTLITSNLRISSETLKRNYGDRVQSRLMEMCNYFEIKGRDRRKSLR